MRPIIVRTLATLAAAAVALSPARLSAQGGRRLARPAQPAAAVVTPAAAGERLLAPAMSVLRTLVGTWHFEIRFAGNFDGPPDVSGVRIVRPLYDTLRLEWTEQLDDSTLAGKGLVGFDQTSGRFFATAVYSSGGAPELMAGTPDDAEPLVTFRPLGLGGQGNQGGQGGQGGQPFALSVVDGDHFVVTALDRGWRAVFTRR